MGKPDPPTDRAAEKTLIKQLGPGLVTGAADDDPSGIATILKPARSSVSVCSGRCC